ncbi:MAG: tRNA (mo5U34)-methyltransferase, partial [Lysobacterales bacterium]
MIDYSKVYNVMKDSVLQPWLETLEGSVHCVFTDKKWGDLPQWLNLLQRLPDVKPSSIDLSSNAIRVGFKEDLTDEQFQLIPKLLEGFFPWRKGPFDLFGTFIDTEWRSDLKWDRFKDDITSLQDRVVLDVGCGSGYHCLRMKGAGAQIVTGIDPTMLYPVQFQVFNKYINDPTVSVLPIGIDDMPDNLERFDTVFSMGLLYHRRAPLDHIHQLKSFLRKGGELVLETLVIEGAAG